MSSQRHQSDPTVLDRRTLQRDHRVLAGLIRPGMAVLDVGCGTGAITRGIAQAVGPAGTVVGVDRDRGLLDRGRAANAALSQLQFIEQDATDLQFHRQFDIVTAARLLQWVADVTAALRGMARAAKPGGTLVILDYNHALNQWDPAPPAEFAEFYRGFLSWRGSSGWDNEMANHCPQLLEQIGMDDIRVEIQDVTVVAGGDDFDEQTMLWLEVIDRLGTSLQTAGVCDPHLLAAARRSYAGWRETQLKRQVLSMRTTLGSVPIDAY
jgi:SAM-dependent methyltransferase